VSQSRPGAGSPGAVASYCIQAYDPNGLKLEQFNDHPATLDTVQVFSKGFSSLETFIGQRAAALRGRKNLLATQN
jgi:hypothetical protein